MKALLKPELIWEIEGALRVTAPQLSDAGVQRIRWYQSLMKLFEDYDFLALPSAQVFPFSRDQLAKNPSTMFLWTHIIDGWKS